METQVQSIEGTKTYDAEKIEEVAETQKAKSVIVGRIWENNGVISGYVIVGNNQKICFGANLSYNPAFLFLSKKQK